MIHQSDKIIPWVCSVNIGRPTFFPDHPETMAYWKEFHKLVEECPIPIGVNTAFWMVKDTLEKDGGYGGGFAYMFWFLNEEDATTFMTLWGGEAKECLND